MLSRLLFLLVSFGFLIPTFSNSTPPWESYLKQKTIEVYGDSVHYVFRREQVRAESSDNPLATSDFKGWKKLNMDTVDAVKSGFGAAGLSQFIFATAQRFDCESVDTKAAFDTEKKNDIYNPYWSLESMCRYMHSIDVILLSTPNGNARKKLMSDKNFSELCSTAAYNCGEGRIQKLLKKYSSWDELKFSLPKETREYAEKIVKGAS
jgi:hypothetical protein